jgi:hypothetical protein
MTFACHNTDNIYARLYATVILIQWETRTNMVGQEFLTPDFKGTAS